MIVLGFFSGIYTLGIVIYLFYKKTWMYKQGYSEGLKDGKTCVNQLQ